MRSRVFLRRVGEAREREERGSEGGSGCEDTRVCAREWECLGEWRPGGARAGSGRGGARAERAPTGPPTAFCLPGAPRRRAFRIQRPLLTRATRRGRATGAPSARRGIQVPPSGARVGDRCRSAGRGEKAGGGCYAVGSGAGTLAPLAGLGEGDRTGSLPPGRRERACDGCLLHRERREDPDRRPLRGERREGSGQVRPPRGAGKGARTAPTSAPGASQGLGGWRPPFLAGQWLE